MGASGNDIGEPVRCRNCDSPSFTDSKCDRCGRPVHEDVDYLEEIEELAGEVVAAAYDEYEELRPTSGLGTPLQQAIVRLDDRLRSYHYDGDGCVDALRDGSPE